MSDEEILDLCHALNIFYIDDENLNLKDENLTDENLTDKQKIIEVKTRTRCFFKDVREYENTQMQIIEHR